MNLNNVIKSIFKALILFFVFGGIYFIIECTFKHKITDYRMFILGGFLGVLIGFINNIFSWETSFILQCLMGTLFVTLFEAICGYEWNIIEQLHIWDYSNLPFSFIGGQINIFFSILWCALSGITIVMDDKLRYYLFGESIYKYRLI